MMSLHVARDFLYVFPGIKPVGSTTGAMLNSCVFNEYVSHVHLQLESITDMINLVQSNGLDLCGRVSFPAYLSSSEITSVPHFLSSAVNTFHVSLKNTRDSGVPLC